MAKKKQKKLNKQNEIAKQMIMRTGGHSGPHKNAPQEEQKTPRKAKHKKPLTEED